MGDGMKKTYKYMLGIVSAFCIALIWNTYIYMVEVVGNDYLNIDLTDTVLHAFQEGNTITLLSSPLRYPHHIPIDEPFISNIIPRTNKTPAITNLYL